MKSFKQFVDDKERLETVEDLEEGKLRTLGSAALFARILAVSKRVKRTKDVGEKIDLLANIFVQLAILEISVDKVTTKGSN